MPLNPSGPISIEDINVELGRAATAAFSMDGVDERALVGVPSGSYSWDDWWGKQLVTEQTGSITTGANIIVGEYGWVTGSYGSSTLLIIELEGADWDLDYIITGSSDLEIRIKGASIESTINENSLVSFEINGHTYTVGAGAGYVYSLGTNQVIYRWTKDSSFADGITYPFTFIT